MDQGPQTSTLSPSEIQALLVDRQQMSERIEALTRQLEWFKKQLFGQKSERRFIEPPPNQLSFGEVFGASDETAPLKIQTIAEHQRKKRTKTASQDDGAELFFDDSVPVQVIDVPNPATDGLNADQYAVIGEKATHRLAQRPGSYVILKYVRQVIKIKCDESLHCPPAPAGVFDKGRADVSFIAGMLVDKFLYHLPLYRQHARLRDAGIKVSRPWLTQVVHKSAALLKPLYEAQWASIRDSRIKLMDETPIKAGRKRKGKMKQGYFWPVLGEEDEIAFLYYPSRASKHVREALGESRVEGAVLITDGYAAYARYAEATGITHAQCWAHTRRKFIEAEDVEPEPVAQALALIRALYKNEKAIVQQKLTGEKKRLYRVTHSQPIVERFFAWANERLTTQGLLPSNPLTVALSYALERRAGLEIFLTDPEVPIDTNPIERALRVIPMGRRNWLFCWTEVGAEVVGIIQSLIVTCRMHGINPYDYLVDVLQRIDQHPASEVHLLTPRLWKVHFADRPLRSLVHQASLRSSTP